MTTTSERPHRSAAIRRAEDAVAVARDTYGLVQLAGPRGTGKTTALRTLQAAHDDAVIVSVWPHMRAPQFALELAAATGCDENNTHQRVVQYVRVHLATEPRLVLVDNIHNGDPSVFDMIVYLLEQPENRCTFVVAGWRTAHWPGPLDERRGDLALRTVRFEPLSDVALFIELRQWDSLLAIADEKALELLDEKAGHGLWSNWSVIRKTACELHPHTGATAFTVKFAAAVLAKMRQARQ